MADFPARSVKHTLDLGSKSPCHWSSFCPRVLPVRPTKIRLATAILFFRLREEVGIVLESPV
jgi:hypothetical protein